MIDNSRTSLPRRENYSEQTSSYVGQFMVPLLHSKIQLMFREYLLPKKEDESALDIGCGEQPLRDAIEAIGYDYKSLDTQQNKSLSVDFLCPIDRDSLEDEVGKNSFNLIVVTEVLEHVADWDLAFKNMSALLAPNGKILITCPHRFQLHEEPFDFWRPTPHAISHFSKRYDLKVLYFEKVGDAWDVLGTLLASFSFDTSACSMPVKALGWGIFIVQKIAYKILASRILQRLLKTSDEVYLSNIAVLQKKCVNPV